MTMCSDWSSARVGVGFIASSGWAFVLPPPPSCALAQIIPSAAFCRCIPMSGSGSRWPTIRLLSCDPCLAASRPISTGSWCCIFRQKPNHGAASSPALIGPTTPRSQPSFRNSPRIPSCQSGCICRKPPTVSNVPPGSSSSSRGSGIRGSASCPNRASERRPPNLDAGGRTADRNTRLFAKAADFATNSPGPSRPPPKAGGPEGASPS